MKNIIFIAPPAASKGTISDYLVRNYNYEHISTGDILRTEVESGSELGKKVKDIMAKGLLIEDEVMIKLVENKFKTLDENKPFILDGFPRTLNQAIMLDKLLVTNHITNMVVIYLDIDLDTAMKRSLGRVVCLNCGRSYNVNFSKLKPKIENKCDACGEALQKRSDDNEATFKVRFDTYMEHANQMKDYYQKKNCLSVVNVNRDIDIIFEDIVKEAGND